LAKKECNQEKKGFANQIENKTKFLIVKCERVNNVVFTMKKVMPFRFLVIIKNIIIGKSVYLCRTDNKHR
jgi:hypothetical protein